MKRTPLRRYGKRAQREAEALAAFRSAVLARGRCEVEGCKRTKNLHAHHIKPRSRGGKHDPSNGIAVCFEHHRAIHDHSLEGWSRYVA